MTPMERGASMSSAGSMELTTMRSTPVPAALVRQRPVSGVESPMEMMAREATGSHCTEWMCRIRPAVLDGVESPGQVAMIAHVVPSSVDFQSAMSAVGDVLYSPM